MKQSRVMSLVEAIANVAVGATLFTEIVAVAVPVAPNVSVTCKATG